MSFRVSREKAPIFHLPDPPTSAWVRFDYMVTDPEAQADFGGIEWKLYGDLVVHPADLIATARAHGVTFETGRWYVVKAGIESRDGLLHISALTAAPKWSNAELAAVKVLNHLAENDVDKLFSLLHLCDPRVIDRIEDMLRPLEVVIPPPTIDPWNARYILKATTVPDWRALYPILRRFNIPALEAKRLAQQSDVVLLEGIKRYEADQLIGQLEEAGVGYELTTIERSVG